MAFIYVLPKHIWESVEDPVDVRQRGDDRLRAAPSWPPSRACPSSWRPTRITRARRTSTRNFQTFEADDARVTALTTGQIDAMLDVPETAIPSLHNAENVVVHIAETAGGGSLTDIIFNITEDENCPPDDGASYRACRAQGPRRAQALAHATDKEQLITVATGGTDPWPVARAARARRLLRVGDRGLCLRHRRGEPDPRRGRLRGQRR